MDTQSNRPTDATPPTLPPGMAPTGPTQTSTTTTVAPAVGTTTGVGRGAAMSTTAIPTGPTGTTSVFAPSNTRNVLGIGGTVTLDTKTLKPIAYFPPVGGAPLTGPMASGTGLYFKGAAEEAIKGFANNETLVSVQAQLYKAGYLSNYTPGRVTMKTVSALERLMGDTNAANSISGQGLTWDQMLAVVAASGGARPASGRSVVRVSNPLDIEAAVNQVAQQLIGRTLDDATMQRFVQAYQAAERGAAYGTTQAPNVQTFTLDKLTQMFPTETYGHQFGSYMEALQKRYGA